MFERCSFFYKRAKRILIFSLQSNEIACIQSYLVLMKKFSLVTTSNCNNYIERVFDNPVTLDALHQSISY